MSEELSFPTAPQRVQPRLDQDALTIKGLRPRPIPEPDPDLSFPQFPAPVQLPAPGGSTGLGGISAEPSTLTAGAPSIITLTGPTLSPVPYGYYITGSTGQVNATIQVLYYSPDLFQVTLQITLPASTPGGSYTLVVQQTRRVQLQVVSAVPAVPKVDSVWPFQIPVGLPILIQVSGQNLPPSGYFIAGPVPVQADFFSFSPSGGNVVTLQVTVRRDQLLPNGAYSLFAQGGSQGATVLLYNP